MAASLSIGVCVVALGISVSAAAQAITIGPDSRISLEAATAQVEPSIAISGDRALAVWYRDNNRVRSGRANWAFSPDGGLSWREGTEVPLQVVGHRIEGKPSACADRQGKFYFACLYSDSYAFNLAVYRCAPSTDSVVWSGPVLVVPWTGSPGEGVVPFDTPRLACDPDREVLYLTYTLVTNVAFGYPARTAVHFLRSLDGGVTWSAPLTLSNDTSVGGRAAVGPDGELYVVWEDQVQGLAMGIKSTDLGASFGLPFVVGSMRDNLATSPPGYLPSPLRGSPVTYCTYRYTPNFPTIAVDRSPGPDRGTVYVAWNDFAEGEPAPPSGWSVVAVEPNEQFANATPVSLGDVVYADIIDLHIEPSDWREVFSFDGVAGTTVWIEGAIYDAYGFWGEGCWPFALLGGPDTLNLRQVAFFQINGPNNWSQPPLIFTLPRTGRYYLASTGFAPSFSLFYWLAFRRFDVAESSVARDHRDVVLVSSRDGGASWSGKTRVNDSPPRFDDCFPDLAVDDYGQVHVAWYDRRDDLTNGARAHAYWTRSLDGGATFQPSVRLSGQPSLWQFNYNGVSNVGDHLGIGAWGDRVHVLWTQQGQPDLDIYGARIIVDAPTAIAVSGLRAEATARGITIRWQVSRVDGLLGFRVHRADQGGTFAPLVHEPRPATYEGSYEVEDVETRPGRSYSYRLEIIHADGSTEWEGPVTLSLPGLPARLAWGSVGPNPFTDAMDLHLVSPGGVETRVAVFDLLGHEVAILHHGGLEPGPNRLRWDGRDRSGRQIAAGVYWLVAQNPWDRIARRITRMR